MTILANSVRLNLVTVRSSYPVMNLHTVWHIRVRFWRSDNL